jgi:hypothetical protein
MNTYHDRDAFSAMNSALRATGAFADVSLGAPGDYSSVGTAQFPLALIEPKGWSETPDSDSSQVVRCVTFDLRLAVRGDYSRDRYEGLDRLMGMVQQALNGSTLGGGCLAPQTRLLRGQFDPTPRSLESQLILTGQFVYLVAAQ